MKSFKPSSVMTAIPWGFGFEQQMRDADWDRFPRWYRARCLLAAAPQDVVETTPVVFRTAA